MFCSSAIAVLTTIRIPAYSGYRSAGAWEYYFAIGMSELQPSTATRHFPSVPRRKMLMPLPLSVMTTPVFFMDIFRSVCVALKRPVANDCEAEQYFLPFSPICAEVSGNSLADGVFTEDLGFVRCMIDDIVSQIGHEYFGIVAVDRRYICTMCRRFDGLRVGHRGVCKRIDANR